MSVMLGPSISTIVFALKSTVVCAMIAVHLAADWINTRVANLMTPIPRPTIPRLSPMACLRATPMAPVTRPILVSHRSTSPFSLTATATKIIAASPIVAIVTSVSIMTWASIKRKTSLL